MNKNLDQLFEQARQSQQAKMPLEQVQSLIQAQPNVPFLSNKKFWIMTISIISILSICTLLFWPNNDAKKPIIATQYQEIITTVQPNYNSSPLALADNLPLPIVHHNNVLPNIMPVVPTKKEQTTSTTTKLDSLGPKETFTEYKLEIKKENSEQEIKKLKTELAQYGIHMDVFELSYNNDHNIKRFKGQFKTDSLFCGSNMDNYQFDISGSFKTMEFIFRVANHKNLKYLKIQSDDFEETIECYDDKVIASTKEAEKMSLRMNAEMQRAREDMARARAEMYKAKSEMDSSFKLNRAEYEKLTENKLKTLERLDSINWEDVSLKIERELGKKFKGKKMETLHEALKDLNIRIESEVNEAMRQLEIELQGMKIEIEDAIHQELELNQNKNYKLEHIEYDRSAKELEDEAKELEKEAKGLRKEAKRKAKEAKENSNN